MNDTYFKYLEKMRENYRNWDGLPASPYDFDNGAFCPMTQIESNLWSDFRACGVPMFYQFPIGKYYADFCDPYHGLVVEADGKQHREQLEKDKKRDAYIRSIGFEILRISGRDTFDRIKTIENESTGERTEIKICDGFEEIKAWYETHGIQIPFINFCSNGMKWPLFYEWKKSLGVEEDREKYNARRKILTSWRDKQDNFYSTKDLIELMDALNKIC